MESDSNNTLFSSLVPRSSEAEEIHPPPSCPNPSSSVMLPNSLPTPITSPLAPPTLGGNGNGNGVGFPLPRLVFPSSISPHAPYSLPPLPQPLRVDGIHASSMEMPFPFPFPPPSLRGQQQPYVSLHCGNGMVANERMTSTTSALPSMLLEPQIPLYPNLDVPLIPSSHRSNEGISQCPWGTIPSATFPTTSNPMETWIGAQERDIAHLRQERELLLYKIQAIRNQSVFLETLNSLRCEQTEMRQRYERYIRRLQRRLLKISSSRSRRERSLLSEDHREEMLGDEHDMIRSRRRTAESPSPKRSRRTMLSGAQKLESASRVCLPENAPRSMLDSTGNLKPRRRRHHAFAVGSRAHVYSDTLWDPDDRSTVYTNEILDDDDDGDDDERLNISFTGRATPLVEKQDDGRIHPSILPSCSNQVTSSLTLSMQPSVPIQASAQYSSNQSPDKEFLVVRNSLPTHPPHALTSSDTPMQPLSYSTSKPPTSFRGNSSSDLPLYGIASAPHLSSLQNGTRFSIKRKYISSSNAEAEISSNPSNPASFSAYGTSDSLSVSSILMRSSFQHEDIISSVRLSSNGEYLAVGTNGAVHLYDLGNVDSRQDSHLFRKFSVALVDDLPTGGEADLSGVGASDASLTHRSRRRADPGSSTKISNRSRFVSTISNSFPHSESPYQQVDRCSRLAPASPTGSKISNVGPKESTSAHGYVRGLGLSDDSHFLAIGAPDFRVHVYDISSGAMQCILADHTDEIYSLAFVPLRTSCSPNSASYSLISGSCDGTLRLWSLRDSNGSLYVESSSVLLNTLDDAYSSRRSRHEPFSYGISSVACSPLSSLILAGAFSQVVYALDPSSQSVVHEFRGHSHSVWDVSWSHTHDSMFASASLDRSVFIWDVRKPSDPAMRLSFHTDYALSVAFGHDGHTLLSSSKDRTIVFWDIRMLRPDVILRGHRNSVLSIDTCMKKPYVFASGSGDRRARIWDFTLGCSPSS